MKDDGVNKKQDVHVIPADKPDRKRLGWIICTQHKFESRKEFNERCDEVEKETGEQVMREYTEYVLKHVDKNKESC